MKRVDGVKPCPFCGGSNLFEESYENGIGWRYRIICGDCYATVDDGTLRSIEDAVEAWNRRSIDEDALKDIADELIDRAGNAEELKSLDSVYRSLVNAVANQFRDYAIRILEAMK